MRKIISFLGVLFLAVLLSACMNNLAIQELNQKAAEYIEKGDTEKAISRLEASIDLDDNIYETRYNLAIAYLKLGKCNEALENILAAKKLAPKEANVYYTLGATNSCVADEFCKARDANAQTLVYNPVDRQKCEQYLKEANIAFEKYLELSPNAEDVQEIKEQIKANETTINIPKS